MLKNKNVLRLLSLVLALFLWFYVVAVENPLSERRISKIPIQFTNHSDLEKRGLAIDYSNIQKMDIVISGTRSDVMKVSADDVSATADLTGYGKGKNYVAVTVKVPRKVDLVEQKVQFISVNVEKLQTAKKKVNINFTGNVAKDRQAKLFSQDLSEVQVTGAKSQVSKVYKVLADLDAAKLTENAKKYNLKIYAADAKGKQIKGVKFSTKTVNATAGMYTVKEVPLNIDLKGEPPAEYRISALDAPKTAKIMGFPADLEGIEKLTSNPVYLDDLKESEKIQIEVDLPEGVELVDPKSLQLEVTIKDMVSKEFVFSSANVDIRGLSEGKNITMDSQTLRVKAFSKDETGDISMDDIQLYVDLTGLDSGEHKVKVRFEAQNDISDVSVEPQDIAVKIE